MNVSKLPKGSWSVRWYASEKAWGVEGEERGPCIALLNDQDTANLLAEAGNVTTETGLSPRQLAERVSVLEKALRTSAEVMKSINPIVFANSILAIEETLAATAGKEA